MPHINKTEIHAEICDSIKSLYAAKNSDYGDSFAITRCEIPTYTLCKLTDKYNRIKTLMLSGSSPNVADESIDDTLLDMANYCIMELTERRIDAISNL